MNVELFERVKEKILAEPENFRMSSFHCGTSFCIAGWAVVLSGYEINAFMKACDASWTHWAEPAMTLLDLTESQAWRFFLPTGWPRQFIEAYRENPAKATIDRINHFIATEGKE